MEVLKVRRLQIQLIKLIKIIFLFILFSVVWYRSHIKDNNRIKHNYI